MADPFAKDPFEPPAHAALGASPPALPGEHHAPLQIDPLATAGAGAGKLPAAQFRIQGTYQYPNKSAPTWLNVTADTPTLAEAQAIAAQYPKSLGITARPLHAADGTIKGIVGMNAKLASDKSIGEVNEAGLKRYQRFLKMAARLGHRIFGVNSTSMGMPIQNAYTSMEELHQYLGLPPHQPAGE